MHEYFIQNALNYDHLDPDSDDAELVPQRCSAVASQYKGSGFEPTGQLGPF